jgi:uncharacterized RDD family membrane protein YckC
LIGRRALARLLDAGFPVLVVTLAPAGTRQAVGLVAIWLYWAYETLLTARLGHTLGKSLARVRVVDADDEHTPSLRQAAIRALPILLLAVPFLWVVVPLVYVWAAFNHDARGLHDLAAGTRVVVRPLVRGVPTR